MRIVADENIPYAAEAFASFGEVTLLAGRGIANADLAGVDALVVRSVTRVDEALLDGTPVRFVGTATIGHDHLDLGYLDRASIDWASAPGCNANSVAEFVTAALVVLERRGLVDIAKSMIGLVGHGNVGKRVEQKARALGMDVLLNDPPLADASGNSRYVALDAVRDCDVISLHCPLVKAGPYPTRHLVGDGFLEACKPGAVLINTSRGAVADNSAILGALRMGSIGAAVLDVFEGEPAPDPALVDAAAIATPHIAGYSFDGKVAGTRMIHEALARHLGQSPTWPGPDPMPPPEHPEVAIESNSTAPVSDAVLQAYDILHDDADLREAQSGTAEARGASFDRLRKTYRRRREFHAKTVRLAASSTSFAEPLRALGFQVALD